VSTVAAAVRHELRDAVEAARPALGNGCSVDELAEHLYLTWYGAPVETVDTPACLPDDLGSALRAAHTGGERWEDGWTVANAGPDGRLLADRDGERRLLDRWDYLDLGRPGVVPAVGATVLAPARRDRADGGWWYTHHASWRLDAPEGELVRVYWSIGPADVPLLVHRLSSVLLDLDTPWMLKCALAPAAYSRADAAVLFVSRVALDSLADILDGAAADLSGALRDTAPPLTLRAGHGVAVADDPGTEMSFGEHRCRLIAEGLLAARDADALLDAVAERFRSAGIPPDRPYAADETRRLPWE
jgi:HopA1 effector protein family